MPSWVAGWRWSKRGERWSWWKGQGWHSSEYQWCIIVKMMTAVETKQFWHKHLFCFLITNILLSEWARSITMYSYYCIIPLWLCCLLLILHLLQGLPGERGLPGSEGKAVSKRFSLGRENPMVQGKKERQEKTAKEEEYCWNSIWDNVTGSSVKPTSLKEKVHFLYPTRWQNLMERTWNTPTLLKGRAERWAETTGDNLSLHEEHSVY